MGNVVSFYYYCANEKARTFRRAIVDYTHNQALASSRYELKVFITEYRSYDQYEVNVFDLETSVLHSVYEINCQKNTIEIIEITEKRKKMRWKRK